MTYDTLICSQQFIKKLGYQIHNQIYVRDLSVLIVLLLSLLKFSLFGIEVFWGIIAGLIYYFFFFFFFFPVLYSYFPMYVLVSITDMSDCNNIQQEKRENGRKKEGTVLLLFSLQAITTMILLRTFNL